MPPSPPSRPLPPTASARERHLGFTTGTSVAAALAVSGLGMASVADPRLGMLLAVVPAAALLLDAVVALQATRRVRMAASVSPAGVVVGDRFNVSLTVTGPRLPVRLALATGRSSSDMVATPPATGALSGVAEARGVISSLTLRPVCAGLCGLVTCTRVHSVALPRPLEIGPRPVEPGHPFPEIGAGWGEGTVVPTGGDLVRGVRPYVPGDRLRQVHWRATARLGGLVVKEAEEPRAPELVMVLDLGAGGPAGEEAAGRAAWLANEALLRGYRVILTTAEGGRTVVDAVATPSAVNGRLARATTGHPTVPTARPPARVLLVTDQGDSWP